ncbi:Pre-mRNA-processing ATP-dependent RNA helicase prp5 [Penicillium chermesinum]|nr:Pre-mRNA-processing ATP-dependent RNA helicase prp5 [Penicillium chermesinum]
MARRGDARSPSPAGSSFSASRRPGNRGRRDDDRGDDRGGHRRSRSPERRYHDRDSARGRDSYRRRDRSVGRRDDGNKYRPGRRDRSPDRRRSRSRDANRDYRRRSRDRDIRSRRDDSRGHDKRRTHDPADLKPKSGRGDSRDRGSARRSRSRGHEVRSALALKTQSTISNSSSQPSKSSTSAAAPAVKSEEEKKAERLAKLAAWKEKQVAERERKRQEEIAGGARNVLDDIDPRAALSSTAVKSPQTPVTPASAFSAEKFEPTTIVKKPSHTTTAGPQPSQISGKAPATRAFGFEDDEPTTRFKPAKLPELTDDGTKDPTLEATIAAERRDKILQGGDQASGSNAMDVEDEVYEEGGHGEEMDEDDAGDDELDPLDAYMTGLGEAGPSGTKRKAPDAPTIFTDDNEPQMTAVGKADAEALAVPKKKKDEVPVVDHSKIEYEDFRKKFYVPPSHHLDMTPEEVKNLRAHLDDIKVRGKDVPVPVSTWAECGLGVQTLDVVSDLGYDHLTAIQAQAIPTLMSGRDVIGIAKTGSGKTIAFLIPMFRHIKDQRPLHKSKKLTEGPIGLILTPTRELAVQIHRECRPFLKKLRLHAACAYGGAPIKDQIAEVKRGAEILVGTPGRVIDLLKTNSGRVLNLQRVTYLVLDEADRMFDMGFESQVMRILGNIRPDRQTALFSATFPPKMEGLARKTLKTPVEIIVGGKSVVAPEITQIVEVIDEKDKFVRLLGLLGELYNDDANQDSRALVFVDRQEAADTLLSMLMHKGYPCNSLHGRKDQLDRDSTIQDFKAGVFPVLVATSVAARGLDVKQLKLVVNYDAPNHLEDYVHRAGRTGRAGNTGTAVTFLTKDQERYAVDVARALRESGHEIPEPVQKMVEAFQEKVKAGQEKAAGNSGFGGKGLERLDKDRETARNRERRTYKTGEENDESEDEELQAKDDERFKKALSQVQSAAAAAPPEPADLPKGIDLDAQIIVHKTERGAGAGPDSKLAQVGSAVADINSRLSRNGAIRSGVPIDNRGPDAGAYHATMEINDFPQKARWAVTNRTNVAKILESTGTSITTKGQLLPSWEDPRERTSCLPFTFL